MEFFDKLSKKASETYKGAAEKTGKLAKEAKLKIKINENKSKINDIYEEIGKKVYQKHIADEELCIKKDLEDECAKIDILSSEIDEYNKEILALSNEKVCENCGEHLSLDAKFCTKCGAEQPEIVEEPAKEVEVVEENASETKCEGCGGCEKTECENSENTSNEETKNNE